MTACPFLLSFFPLPLTASTRTKAETPRTQNALKIAPKTGFFISLIDCTSRAETSRETAEKGVKMKTAKRTPQRQTRNRQKTHGNGAKSHESRTDGQTHGDSVNGRKNAKIKGEKIRHRRLPAPPFTDCHRATPRHEKRTAEAVPKKRGYMPTPIPPL